MNSTHVKLCEQSQKFATNIIISARATHRNCLHTHLDKVIKKTNNVATLTSYSGTTALSRAESAIEELEALEKIGLRQLQSIIHSETPTVQSKSTSASENSNQDPASL